MSSLTANRKYEITINRRQTKHSQGNAELRFAHVTAVTADARCAGVGWKRYKMTLVEPSESVASTAPQACVRIAV